jgi:glucose/arabinose dehydrogenase
MITYGPFKNIYIRRGSVHIALLWQVITSILLGRMHLKDSYGRLMLLSRVLGFDSSDSGRHNALNLITYKYILVLFVTVLFFKYHPHCSPRLLITIMLVPHVFFVLYSPELDYVEAGRSGAEENDVRVLHNADNQPIIVDADLKVEQVVESLELPTSMAFLGFNDFLVLEKQKGTIKRIVNDTMLDQPVLDVSVANENERGMLGIAVEKEVDSKTKRVSSTHVFVAFTEADEDGSDDCSSSITCKQDRSPIGNRLYRYELVNNELTNPELLLDLPSAPGPAHNGGALLIGPDHQIYLTIGDVRCGCTQAANVQEGGKPEGRAGILRLTPAGEPVPNDAIIGGDDPLYFYYAYGVRNSFGIAFDPVTGKLWDTENGAGSNDEINLVEPGFNSG